MAVHLYHLCTLKLDIWVGSIEKLLTYGLIIFDPYCCDMLMIRFFCLDFRGWTLVAVVQLAKQVASFAKPFNSKDNASGKEQGLTT